MAQQKTALVLGAGGFIGSHMVKRLIKEGYWVRGVDIKYPEFSETMAHEFIIGDLRSHTVVEGVLSVNNDTFDEIYQFAADMGGAGYIFTDEHSADIMHNSASINLNILDRQKTTYSTVQVSRVESFAISRVFSSIAKVNTREIVLPSLIAKYQSKTAIYGTKIRKEAQNFLHSRKFIYPRNLIFALDVRES